MTSSSPSAGRAVLRGASAHVVTAARLGGELREGTAARYGTDPRLADPVLEQAFTEAVGRARDDAAERGYAEGHRAGLAAASAAAGQLRAELEDQARRAQDLRDAATEQVLLAVVSAAQDLAGRQAVDLAANAQALLLAAVEIAEALVADHLHSRTEPGLDAVRRALAALPEPDGEVRLHLHPQDAGTLSAEALARLAGAAPVTVVPDPAVERGGCVARAGATTVDAQLGVAVARVRAVLSS